MPEMLQPKQTIGIAIIVKSEAKTIRKCIQSIAPFVDQVVICGQNDTDAETKKEIRIASDKVEYSDYGAWQNDFAAKRNFSFGKLNTDWFLWIDSDDIVLHP